MKTFLPLVSLIGLGLVVLVFVVWSTYGSKIQQGANTIQQLNNQVNSISFSSFSPLAWLGIAVVVIIIILLSAR